MSNSIIKAENVSKRFYLSHEKTERYTALRDVIANKLKTIFTARDTPGSRDEFWALKDLNFEIQQGDRVGIIGRNGAGKSTLLKILSRITEPSSGRITIKGRVASLLEVGTGFHPELTGRENIFLNGAILGMSRAEIRSKFDEIVDFAEVERFLDTPVKRYSSGMYVRLAFAVAAHLEPEVLIVDEVLAVGDAQFQKKCLGKMDDVSKKEGRTVLFVSHNMAAIKNLCNKGMLLANGQLLIQSGITEVIDRYISSMQVKGEDRNLQKYNNEHIQLNSVSIKHSFNDLSVSFDKPLVLVLTGRATGKMRNVSFAIGLVNFEQVAVLTTRHTDTDEAYTLDGDFSVEVEIRHNLRAGLYSVIVGIEASGQGIYFNPAAHEVEVLDVGEHVYHHRNYGLINVESKWTLKD